MTKLEKKQEVIEKQLDFLDIEKIREYTKCKWMAKEVVLLEETGSTNVEAARLAQQGRDHGTVVIADRQTCGKGRRGRSWHTPGNTSIAMSFLLKPQLEAEYASMLTLVQAMAVAEAVEEVTALKSQIKWPNDILINEKKWDDLCVEYIISRLGFNLKDLVHYNKKTSKYDPNLLAFDKRHKLLKVLNHIASAINDFPHPGGP